MTSKEILTSLDSQVICATIYNTNNIKKILVSKSPHIKIPENATFSIYHFIVITTLFI